MAYSNARREPIVGFYSYNRLNLQVYSPKAFCGLRVARRSTVIAPLTIFLQDKYIKVNNSLNVDWLVSKLLEALLTS